MPPEEERVPAETWDTQKEPVRSPCKQRLNCDQNELRTDKRCPKRRHEGRESEGEGAEKLYHPPNDETCKQPTHKTSEATSLKWGAFRKERTCARPRYRPKEIGIP